MKPKMILYLMLLIIYLVILFIRISNIDHKYILFSLSSIALTSILYWLRDQFARINGQFSRYKEPYLGALVAYLLSIVILYL